MPAISPRSKSEIRNFIQKRTYVLTQDYANMKPGQRERKLKSENLLHNRFYLSRKTKDLPQCHGEHRENNKLNSSVDA